MGLNVEFSTARVNASSVLAATTASFSPAQDILLVAMSHANSNTTGSVTCAITNSGTGLTWTQATFANFANGGQPGGTFIHWAAVPAAQAGITVTATTTNNNSTTADRYVSLRVWGISGANLVSPIGGNNRGGSTTNNLTTTSFNTTGAYSLGFCGGTDWAAASGSTVSSDMGSNGDSFNSTNVLNGYSGWKALSAAGAATTFNLDAPGSSASQWTWAAVEILAAPRQVAPRGGRARYRASFY